VKNIIFIIYTALFLAACGGSSSSTTSTPNNSDNSEAVSKIGVFIDAPVKGLVYVSSPSGKDGVTNEKGEFEYIDGDTVSFNMGFIELGKAVPDKDKTVKVTQLREALLVAQLLQVLDADADENKIDVSDILIPKEIEETILKRLKGTAEILDEDENIITTEEFRAIKQKNPDKLTLQQRTEIVTKDRALEHIKQQIAESGLKFSTSSLENQWLIDSVFLTTYAGGILGFSTAGHSINWVEVFDSKAEYSGVPWSVDSQGDLEVTLRKNDSCRLSKLAEGDLIHFDYACTKAGSKGIRSLTKPKPFSANDLSGKSFNFTSLSGNKETLTFRNDGALNCNGENSSCPYKDHPSYKNTVWIEGGGDRGEKDTFIILAQGTLAKGKLLLIHYKDDGNTLDSVEVIKVSENTLKQVFRVDSLEGSSANDIISDNDQPTTDENKFSSGMPEGFTAPPKDAAVTDALVDYYNPSTGETWESSTGGYQLAPGWIIGTKEDYERNKEYYDNFLAEDGNVAYIPFTQDMISGKTLYNVYTDWDDEDKDGNKTEWMAVTFSFDESSNSGEGMFGIHDSITKADASFNYSINDKGYLILSNVSFTNPEDDPDDGHNMDAIALIEDTGGSFKLCWRGSSEQLESGNSCDGNERFYKTKADAEAALKAPEIPYPNTQNPAYSPFNMDMISGKILYEVYTDWDDEDKDGRTTDLVAVSFIFDESNRGESVFGINDSFSTADTNFDYSIDDNGYLILSNLIFTNPDDDPGHGHNTRVVGLIEETEDYFKVCWNLPVNNIKDLCGDGAKTVLYKTKTAAEAALNSQSPSYIPFTYEKLSEKRYYALGVEDGEGITIFFGGDNKGQVWLSLTESTSSPDMTFDYIIDSAGYVIFSNVLEKGVRSNYKPAIALLGEIKNTLVVCWDNFSVNNITDLCEDDTKMVLYKTKEAAEAEVRAHGEPDTQISIHIPFTTDMIKGKTLYSFTPPDDYDNEFTEVTVQFDNSTGKFQFGYHDNVTSPYGTFDYRIDSQGYLIFSNVVIDGSPIPVSPIHALMKQESAFLEVCVASSEESIACIEEVWFYDKKDAEAAVENL
jgi:hypothetical protein